MELLNELTALVKDGFYVTIVVMFLFYFIPFQLIKIEWLKQMLLRLTIVLVAFVIVWLMNENSIFDWTKMMVKEALIALSFSSLFYEFAGKFIVKKWFKSYKMKGTEK